MPKSFKIVLAYIISWMFFFPITFTFLPAGINSKMLVAALGVVIYMVKLGRRESEFAISPQLLVMISLAALFSIECYGSITYNNTHDMDYTTYIVSMFVWLGAAYTSCTLIKSAHGNAKIETICYYIVALCVGQAIVALFMTMSPAFFSFLNRFFVVFENTNTWESRLYGLGTSSDTGGIRFALALIALGFLISKNNNTAKDYFIFYICFFIIFAIGNMMSRTTSVGGAIAIGFIIINSIWNSLVNNAHLSSSGLGMFFLSATIVGAITYIAYSYSPVIKELVEFGFEGFFNYAESGEFSTHSSDNLTDMWSVWPDNLKTWLIGDGLFMDPYDKTKFYMRTDVGYARIIFYCGTIGLSLFASFLAYVSISTAKRFNSSAVLFTLILVFQLVVWVKVATDLFFILAFLFFAEQDDENDEEDENNMITDENRI